MCSNASSSSSGKFKGQSTGKVSLSPGARAAMTGTLANEASIEINTSPSNRDGIIRKSKAYSLLATFGTVSYTSTLEYSRESFCISF